MARIRTIKPPFFRHEGLQDLERANAGKYPMLVFAGLWGHCDKAGRFEWKPRQLKLDILPFLDFDMTDTLSILERGGFIERYEVGGREYGVIRSFTSHQRINGKEAQEPEKHPQPPEHQQGSNGEAFGQHRGSSRDDRKGREGKGNGRGTSLAKEEIYTPPTECTQGATPEKNAPLGEKNRRANSSNPLVESARRISPDATLGKEDF